jgi:phosphoglycerate kinase
MPKARLFDLPDDAYRGATVLVRLDLNVPLEDGRVRDDTRISAALPTLNYLVERGARVVATSHLGRPDGVDPSLSLAPVARRLGELLGRDVAFVDQTVGPEVEAAVAQLGDGDVLLLENTRFASEETANDPAFAAKLANAADIFVQDAFGTVHRAHASTEGAPRVLRGRGRPAVAGLLLERELRWLSGLTHDPSPPFVAILGGAKISGKIDVIKALLPRVDRLLVCGAMANTFWLAKGHSVGTSLVEPDRVDMARAVMEAAGDRVVLPTDARAATALDGSVAPRVTGPDDVRDDEAIGDIGPETEANFIHIVGSARTVLWNGPAGIFEEPAFATGTHAIARMVVDAAERGAVTVVGGGDSARAVAESGLADRIGHVSTGGGASLEYLAGRQLPGVAVLSEAGEVQGVGA